MTAPAVRVEVRRRHRPAPEPLEILAAIGDVAAKLPAPPVSPQLMASLKALGPAPRDLQFDAADERAGGLPPSVRRA